ncbi:MAG: hypothetical protein ABFC21_08805, partial [Rectinema sp.]
SIRLLRNLNSLLIIRTLKQVNYGVVSGGIDAGGRYSWYFHVLKYREQPVTKPRRRFIWPKKNSSVPNLI